MRSQQLACAHHRRRSGPSSCASGGTSSGRPGPRRRPAQTPRSCGGCGGSSRSRARSGISQKKRRRSSRKSSGEVRLHRAAPGRIPDSLDVSGARGLTGGLLRGVAEAQRAADDRKTSSAFALYRTIGSEPDRWHPPRPGCQIFHELDNQLKRGVH